LTGSSLRSAAAFTPGSSRRKANLYIVMWRAWGINSFAASNMFARGQVKIDGFVVPAPWARGHWTEEQLRGRMLECMRGQVRLYGSMPADRACVVVNEQLELGR
jgi:hypothetical protein